MKFLKFYFFIFIGIFSFQCLIAQELDNGLSSAAEAYRQLEYARAIPLYEKLVNNSPNSEKYIEKLAICYYKIKNYKSAQEWLKRALELNPDQNELRYLYGNAIEHLGNYRFAISQYKFMEASDKKDSIRIKSRIASCNQALKLSNLKSEYKIGNDSLLNTNGSEFSVYIIPEGILFSSDRPMEEIKKYKKQIYGGTNTNFLNLYLSKRLKNGKLDKPSLYSKSLVNDFHTSNAVLSKDQKMIFFTRTESVRNPDKTFKKETKGGDFVNRLQIFYARWKDGSWSAPIPFPFNKVEEYSVGHPSLSLDGSKLYFASDMPGGRGGIDLYYSEITNGSFSKPINLGDSINTVGDEEFPMIGLDGMLYFASDGHPGLGGLDIFKDSGLGNHWTKPENMGSPINSSMDDFGFSTEDSLATKGYFNSNRPEGKGSDDIYTFSRPVPIPLPKKDSIPGDSIGLFIGKIVDAETGKEIKNASIAFRSLSKLEEKDIMSDSVGNYKVNISSGKSYEIKVKKDHYFTKFDTLNFDNLGHLTRAFTYTKVSPIVVDKPIRLENIYYDFNRWTILPQAAHILDGLVKVLKDNPEIVITLDSHTDTRGDNKINMFVSEHRAKSAVDYLISQGINPTRLTARGFGKTKPIVRCDEGHVCTEEDHQLNRRTEFSVVKILKH